MLMNIDVPRNRHCAVWAATVPIAISIVAWIFVGVSAGHFSGISRFVLKLLFGVSMSVSGPFSAIILRNELPLPILTITALATYTVWIIVIKYTAAGRCHWLVHFSLMLGWCVAGTVLGGLNSLD